MSDIVSAARLAPDIEDITGQVTHPLNDEDRVYRLQGVVVKIKTRPVPELTTFGRETLRLTASICDDAGRAQVVATDDAGAPIHARVDDSHLVTFCATMTADGVPLADPLDDLEDVRRRYVRVALHALRTRARLASALGVAPSPLKLRSSMP